MLTRTGARGLMIGRGVIRSPWLFNQIRQQLRGEAVTQPTGRDVWDYIHALWDSQTVSDKPEKVQCERMKKFLNYLGEGVPGAFLHQIRRSQTADEFHRICREFLDHDQPMAMLPAELTCPSPRLQWPAPQIAGLARSAPSCISMLVKS